MSPGCVRQSVREIYLSAEWAQFRGISRSTSTRGAGRASAPIRSTRRTANAGKRGHAATIHRFMATRGRDSARRDKGGRPPGNPGRPGQSARSASNTPGAKETKQNFAAGREVSSFPPGRFRGPRQLLMLCGRRGDSARSWRNMAIATTHHLPAFGQKTCRIIRTLDSASPRDGGPIRRRSFCRIGANFFNGDPAQYRRGAAGR